METKKVVEDGHIYIGEWKDNKKHGVGRQFYIDD